MGVGAVIDKNSDISLIVDSGTIVYKNVNLPAFMSVFDLSGNKMMEKVLCSEEGTLATVLSGMHVVTINSPAGNFVKKEILSVCNLFQRNSGAWKCFEIFY